MRKNSVNEISIIRFKIIKPICYINQKAVILSITPVTKALKAKYLQSLSPIRTYGITNPLTAPAKSLITYFIKKAGIFWGHYSSDQNNHSTKTTMKLLLTMVLQKLQLFHPILRKIFSIFGFPLSDKRI